MRDDRDDRDDGGGGRSLWSGLYDRWARRKALARLVRGCDGMSGTPRDALS